MIPIQYIPVLILAALNFIAFIVVGLDKKKSISHHERIPEVYFFVWAVCFASLGILLGMFFFRHKTRKWYFPFGIFILLLEQAGLGYLLLNVIFKQP